MRKSMFFKTLSILCLCCGTAVVSTAQGEAKPESRSREALNQEKSNLEKLNVQLRILEMEAREDALRLQKGVALEPKPDIDEQEEGEPVVISPGEDVMI